MESYFPDSLYSLCLCVVAAHLRKQPLLPAFVVFFGMDRRLVCPWILGRLPVDTGMRALLLGFLFGLGFCLCSRPSSATGYVPQSSETVMGSAISFDWAEGQPVFPSWVALLFESVLV